MSTRSTNKGRQAKAAERDKAVSNAVHSNEMEGLTVTAEWRNDAASFVEGGIDATELRRRTRSRYGVS